LDISVQIYSVGSLKQQSAGRYVAPLEHVILISSLPVVALTDMLTA